MEGSGRIPRGRGFSLNLTGLSCVGGGTEDAEAQSPAGRREQSPHLGRLEPEARDFTSQGLVGAGDAGLHRGAGAGPAWTVLKLM